MISEKNPFSQKLSRDLELKLQNMVPNLIQTVLRKSHLARNLNYFQDFRRPYLGTACVLANFGHGESSAKFSSVYLSSSCFGDFQIVKALFHFEFLHNF